MNRFLEPMILTAEGGPSGDARDGETLRSVPESAQGHSDCGLADPDRGGLGVHADGRGEPLREVQAADHGLHATLDHDRVTSRRGGPRGPASDKGYRRGEKCRGRGCQSLITIRSSQPFAGVITRYLVCGACGRRYGKIVVPDPNGRTDDDAEPVATAGFAPTSARPGSRDKVAVLAARYAAGLPLWHHEDCLTHGAPDDDGRAPVAEAAFELEDEDDGDDLD